MLHNEHGQKVVKDIFEDMKKKLDVLIFQTYRQIKKT